MEKIAAYCGTRDVYSNIITSVKALVANSAVDEVHIFIEDDDLGEEVPDIIFCHNISNQSYFESDSPNIQNSNDYIKMMYMALCHELAYDNVLALTYNAIPQEDLTKIWDIDLKDYYFSGVPIIRRSTYSTTYCDFSVIYYNLKKMREGKADECIDVLNHTFFPQKHQDVCNYLCQGYIHTMPAKYNTTRFTNQNRYIPAIISFSDVPLKNWINKGVVLKWREMSWEQVMERHNKIVEQYETKG